MKLEIALELLKENGYKLTSQRRIIFEILQAHNHEHLTPEEIHNFTKDSSENIGIATVYRTLLLFDNLGIVQKLTIDDNGARYELAKDLDSHDHHHLVCSNCGKVEEVSIDLLDEAEEKIEKSHGFKIKNHDLKFYGLCEKCKK